MGEGPAARCAAPPRGLQVCLKQKELAALLDHLNLDARNPAVVMTQDMARRCVLFMCLCIHLCEQICVLILLVVRIYFVRVCVFACLSGGQGDLQRE